MTHLGRTDTAALLHEGRGLLQTGRLAEAEAIYEQILQARPGDFDVTMLLAFLRFQRADYAGAVRHLDAASAMRPDNAQAHYNRGLALHQLGRFEEAVASYERAVALSAGYVEAFYNRALALGELDRLEEALASYDRAAALKPNGADIFNNRGNVLVRLARFDEAVASYRRAVALKPDYVEALNNCGHALEQQREIEAALLCYDRALAAKPDHAQSWHNRANALQALKRFEAALASFERAVALKPDHVEAHNNRGNALQELGRYEEALACYAGALALQGDYAEAWINRGNALQRLNRFDEALASYDEARGLRPEQADIFYNKGVALFALKRFDEALASYDRALSLQKDHADAWHNRGNALQELKQYEAALASYESALTLKPDRAETFNNRGNALLLLKRFDEALASYRQALALDPLYAETWYNRGIALHALKLAAEAVTSYDRAISLKPDHAEALSNRGYALIELKRFDEALASCDAALALKPDLAEALNNRGNVWQNLGRHDRAIADFERALALDPDILYARGQWLHSKMHCADWHALDQEIAGVREDIRARRRTISPFCFLSLCGDAGDQLLCSRIWSEDKSPVVPMPAVTPTRRRHDRIRLAYLSADYHDHPVSYLMAGLFERHDRARFTVNAVSYGPDKRGRMRPRLEAAFDRFIDVQGMTDRAVADLLHDLEIDIAVDLTGFTQNGRFGILAPRPASIQINYLGFPGTMGADYIDYIIADRFVIPPEYCNYYTEKVVFLPDTFQPPGAVRGSVAPLPSRSELGLPEGALVFCSFNNTYKITPAMFDIWMRLLQAVEVSVLWLLAGSAELERNLRREAQLRGVAASRLVFAPRAEYHEYLSRYCLADLFLDTLPFNGGTTASDALWAGLPLVTCTGEAFASRMAGSLLNAVGLGELVTHNLADYEALALRLGRDRTKIADIKARLAANGPHHALFDGDRFRRHIEAAYIAMWDRHQRGEPPAAFAVEACAP